MKPQQTLSIFATLAPVIAAAPQILIVVGVVAGIAWLFSSDDEAAAPSLPAPQPAPAPLALMEAAGPVDSEPSRPGRRRIPRDDLAEALEYGVRAMTRTEAVAAFQNLGFQKTAAYKALSPDGRFPELLQHTPDGLIEWQG